MLKGVLIVFMLLFSLGAHAVTECTEKITHYFVGTSELNESVAHLWVNFQGGGSASVRSESAAFDSILSTVMMSIAADKQIRVRYVEDNVDCKQHHADWVGVWLFK